MWIAKTSFRYHCILLWNEIQHLFFFAMVHSAQKSLSQVRNFFLRYRQTNLQDLWMHYSSIFWALCLGTNCKLSIIEYRQNNTQFILSNHCHHFLILIFFSQCSFRKHIVLAKFKTTFLKKAKKDYKIKMVFWKVFLFQF